MVERPLPHCVAVEKKLRVIFRCSKETAKTMSETVLIISC